MTRHLLFVAVIATSVSKPFAFPAVNELFGQLHGRSQPPCTVSACFTLRDRTEIRSSLETPPPGRIIYPSNHSKQTLENLSPSFGAAKIQAPVSHHKTFLKKNLFFFSANPSLISQTKHPPLKSGRKGTSPITLKTNFFESFF
jgi:hypothetical protein